MLIAAALIAGSFAWPAEAGWRDTRWGMSPAEFRALYPQAVRLEPSNVNENWEAWFALYGVAYEGRTWDKATFEFRYGKLESVSLKTAATIQEPLVATFRARYGAPRFEVSEWITWCVSGESVSVHWWTEHPEWGTTVSYSDC
jgi:hypothetical protein